MSDIDEATRARINKLPAWVATLISELQGHTATLEHELGELRGAMTGKHEGTEVRLMATEDELPLPAGSEIEFTLGAGDNNSVTARVENGALRITAIGDMLIAPQNEFTIEVRTR